MQCPNCDEKMEAIVTRGVEANRCLYCEGTWLSKSTLISINLDPAHREAIDTLLENDKAITDESTNRKCPECPDTKLHMIYNNKLELDRCPTCSGVFFDKGELRNQSDKNGETKEEGVAKSLAMEGGFWAILAIFGN